MLAASVNVKDFGLRAVAESVDKTNSATLPRNLEGIREYTSSPTLREVTAVPTAAITPAQSYPILYGNLNEHVNR
jgi:hypothetical protein